MAGGLTSSIVLQFVLVLGAMSAVWAATMWRRRRAQEEQGRSEEMLQSAAATLTQTGEEFLRAVAKEIARALHADIAFIGEFVGENVVQTVAVQRGGQVAENF